jgi:predicted oxidoreductase
VSMDELQRDAGLTLAHAERRPLGFDGLSVSPLAWGMWRLAGEVADAQAKVEAAMEAGIDLFDTADIYGYTEPGGFGSAEGLLGRVLKAAPHLRRRMVLATKGGIIPPVPYNSSAGYLIEACEASLRRLGVERVELYQIHRPDLLAHPAEIGHALDTLRHQGKIAEAGVSNFTPTQVAALQAHMPFRLATIQPEFSPLTIDPISDGVLDQALELNLTVLAWSPLGGGRLGDAAPEDARAAAVAGALDLIAKPQGVSRTSVAYAWGMAHPSRPIPIVGSQDPARIRASAEALKVRLTRVDWYAVLTAARGARLP